jgi:hypothetical protein
MYTLIARKCILPFPLAGRCPTKAHKEAGMRMWAFTVALFLGLVTWGGDLLDNNSAAGDQRTITDGGGLDNGTVTMMEDPFGLPPPKP